MADFLDFILANVPIQDWHYAAFSLASNPATRLRLWEWIQENFDMLYKKLSANMVVWERFIGGSIKYFTDFEKEKEITAYFAGKDMTGYDRAISIVSDTIKGRAAYKARDAKSILAWLQENGYA